MLDVRQISVKQAFDVFEERLRLAPGERARAEASHNAMTVYLITGGVAVATFLQGSFRRKTMRRPLRDIDKVVILPDALRATLFSSAAGPDRATDLLQEVITRHYPSAAFERSRHALKVTLASQKFTFDLVPAFEKVGSDGDVLIANRDTGGWDPSNTRALIRTVAQRNQDCGGRFVQQVRMAKEWASRVAESHSVVFPGLHVESLAYLAITETLDHPLACARFFEAGSRALLGSYTDLTGVDVVSQKLKGSTAAVMTAACGESAIQARRAVTCAAAGDHDAAAHIWHGLFGDAFPTPSRPAEAAALGAAFAGGSVVEGAVTPSRTGPQVMRPTRAWRP